MAYILCHGAGRTECIKAHIVTLCRNKHFATALAARSASAGWRAPVMSDLFATALSARSASYLYR